MRTLRCLRSVASTYSFLSSTGAHAAAQLGQGLTLVPALSAMQTLIASKQLLVWGPGTTLATFSTQLSRVPFTTASMDSSSNPLKTLLGCSEDQLQRMTRLYPGLPSIKHERQSRNIAELVVLLEPLGFTADSVKRIVVKQPRLLSSKPVTLASNLEALKALPGPAAHWLHYVIKQAPSLLTFSPYTLATRLNGLQGILNCSRDSVCRIVASAPTLARADVGAVAIRLQQLRAVLGLSLSDVQSMSHRQPTLLNMRPNLINLKLTAWAQSLGLTKSTIARTIYSYPVLAALDSQAVSAHMRALQALVQRSTLWSTACYNKSSRAAQGAENDVLSCDAYRQFAGEACAVLRRELPELHERDLMAAADELWKQYKAWRVQHDALRLQPNLQMQPLLQQNEADVSKPPAFRDYKATELAKYTAAHPNASQHEALQAVRQQHKELQQRWQKQQIAALQQLQAQPSAVQHRTKPGPWPLVYSSNPSGRLLLRLEYLLATDQHEHVSLCQAHNTNQTNWSHSQPGYSGWVQARLQHLQQNPLEWDPVLLRRAVKWHAAQGADSCGQSASDTLAAAVAKSKLQSRRKSAAAAGSSKAS